MFKKIMLPIYALCLCLGLSGCSSSGSISTFTIGVEKMPSNLDPQIATEKSDVLVLSNVFDGLFEKRNGKVEKNLVEEYTVSSDGKTYTMKLKEGSVYHYSDGKSTSFEGTPVTANDFVFALRRVADPTTHSPYIDYFSNIENAENIKNGASATTLGVSAPNDYTLIIRLNSPDFNFTEKLCSTAALPCNEKFFLFTKGSYGLSVKSLMSNGPFKLTYLESAGENATIVRSDDAPKSAVQRIRIKKISAADQPKSFANETISGFFSFDGAEVEGINASFTKFDSANISLIFNQHNPQFSNVKIRQALSYYAYSFKNSGANLSVVSPTGSLFPDTISLAGQIVGENSASYAPPYMNNDPKNMLSTGLSQIGLSKPASATILMPNDSIYTIVFENINQLWQRDLGLYFSIEYLSTEQINQRIAKGDYELAFLPLSPKDDTPYGILDVYNGYSEEFSNLLLEAKSMADQANALPNVRRCGKILLEDAVLVPMGKESTVFYHQKYFSDIYIDPFTYVINLKYAKAR
ncbi:MAG: ABC transporter substrate-binding protein [Oscillospiraceae bacterium]